MLIRKIMAVWSVLATLLLSAAAAAMEDKSEPGLEASIPLYTADLDARLQPWCPNHCVDEIAFTAEYHRGDQTLVFVAAHHDFNERSATKRAVAAGFRKGAPKVVILEGFPTVMGENPPPLVAEAKRFGTPEANEFARGEGMYAAALALKHGIPFMGGEPTRAEERAALHAHGYSDEDIAFAYLVGGLSQSLRAQTLQGPNDPRLSEVFSVWAHAFRDQYQLEPLSLTKFLERYRAAFGTDFSHDSDITERAEPGGKSIVSHLDQIDMHTRDVHLFELIQTQLEARKSVLVVYGGSHWSTLSGSLEKLLGAPKITTFH